jgi:ATP-dependent DNA helicase DinG
MLEQAVFELDRQDAPHGFVNARHADFAVPNHPLIQARCERIQKLGGNPFGDYSIPDAVLKFRQGIGRLIRSKTDTGIIVVLDPRIMTKSYGRSFLESIPACPIEHF